MQPAPVPVLPVRGRTADAMLRILVVVLALTGILWMHGMAGSHDTMGMLGTGSAASATGDGMLMGATSAVTPFIGGPAAVARPSVPEAPEESLVSLCLAVASGLLGAAVLIALLLAASTRRPQLPSAESRRRRGERAQDYLPPPPCLTALGISRT